MKKRSGRKPAVTSSPRATRKPRRARVRLEAPGVSEAALDLARRAGLIGCVEKGPSDLSTNRKHFEGFGRR